MISMRLEPMSNNIGRTITKNMVVVLLLAWGWLGISEWRITRFMFRRLLRYRELGGQLKMVALNPYARLLMSG